MILILLIHPCYLLYHNPLLLIVLFYDTRNAKNKISFYALFNNKTNHCNIFILKKWVSLSSWNNSLTSIIWLYEARHVKKRTIFTTCSIIKQIIETWFLEKNGQPLIQDIFCKKLSSKTFFGSFLSKWFLQLWFW